MSNKQTKWLPIPSVAEGMGNLEQAAAILRKGGLVAIPTETVYGLAADATNPQAVTSIFEAGSIIVKVIYTLIGICGLVNIGVLFHHIDSHPFE